MIDVTIKSAEPYVMYGLPEGWKIDAEIPKSHGLHEVAVTCPSKANVRWLNRAVQRADRMVLNTPAYTASGWIQGFHVLMTDPAQDRVTLLISLDVDAVSFRTGALP
jgi:hypothetical protein